MFNLRRNKTFPEWQMLSDKGNQLVDEIVSTARKEKLSWPHVWKNLYLLHQTHGFSEAMDKEVTRLVYSRLGYRTPFYFYGLTVNGKTLFDVFPELGM